VPRGDKSRYTETEERTAGYIPDGYETRGARANEAQPHARATWAAGSWSSHVAVPKSCSVAEGMDGTDGKASLSRPVEARSASAKKVAARGARGRTEAARRHRFDTKVGEVAQIAEVFGRWHTFNKGRHTSSCQPAISL